MSGGSFCVAAGPTVPRTAAFSRILAIIVVLLSFLLASPEARPQSGPHWYRVPAPGDIEKTYVTPDSILFACTTTGLYKENLRSRAWGFYSSADGFIGNNVSGVTADTSGRLYFASSPVAIYTDDAFLSIPTDSIPYAADLLVDRRGWLWAAAGFADYQHTPAGWSQISSGIGTSNHLSLALDSAGNVWSGGYDDAAYYDSSGWHVENIRVVGIRGPVMTISVAPDSTVWVGAYLLGYLKITHDGGRRWVLAYPNYFPASITGIAVRNDTVWIAARGLYRMIDSSLTQLHVAEGIASDVATSAGFDRWGQLWIGYANGILSIFKNGSWETKSIRHLLPDYHASSLAVSSTGTVCVGTRYGGLAYYNGTNWSSVETGLPSDTINAVRFDQKGNLWVATPDGIGMYDGNVWHTYTTSDGLLSNAVSALAVSNKDSVWCAAGRSLAKFNGSTWVSYPFPESYGIYGIADIAIDSSGSVWAATDSGIVHFDGTSLNQYYPIVKHTGILSIAVDRNGVKWCGSDSSGGWKYNDTSWKAIGYPDLDGSPTSAVRIAPNGTIWFGSEYGGVARNDGSGWQQFDETDGLAGGTINAFAFDSSGNTWTASDGGVTLYNSAGVVLSTSAMEEARVPPTIVLSQNYPNPFNPTTRIDFQLPRASDVRLEVFDLLGRSVALLAGGEVAGGFHSVTWDADRFPSGVYFLRLTSRGGALTRKMILLR